MNFRSTFWGILLVLIGTLILLNQLFPAFDDDLIPPILLIGGGVMLIFKNQFKNKDIN